MPTHAELVAALAKPAADIIAGLTVESAHLLHMAVGISGEAGELLDAVKKAAIYVKPIDRVNVIEELGDLEFYMEGLRQGLAITREETIVSNIAKLSKRYAAGKYSNAAAQERADKVETPAPVTPAPAVETVAGSHQQRVRDELAALDKKIEKLAGFIDSPLFTAIEKKEARLLTDQLSVMSVYAGILKQRVLLFTA